MNHHDLFVEWDWEDVDTWNNLDWNNGEAALPDVSHQVDTELVRSRHSKNYRLEFRTCKTTVRDLETVTSTDSFDDCGNLVAGVKDTS